MIRALNFQHFLHENQSSLTPAEIQELAELGLISDPTPAFMAALENQEGFGLSADILNSGEFFDTGTIEILIDNSYLFPELSMELAETLQLEDEPEPDFDVLFIVNLYSGIITTKLTMREENLNYRFIDSSSVKTGPRQEFRLSADDDSARLVANSVFDWINSYIDESIVIEGEECTPLYAQIVRLYRKNIKRYLRRISKK